MILASPTCRGRFTPAAVMDTRRECSTSRLATGISGARRRLRRCESSAGIRHRSALRASNWRDYEALVAGTTAPWPDCPRARSGEASRLLHPNRAHSAGRVALPRRLGGPSEPPLGRARKTTRLSPFHPCLDSYAAFLCKVRTVSCGKRLTGQSIGKRPQRRGRESPLHPAPYGCPWLRRSARVGAAAKDVGAWSDTGGRGRRSLRASNQIRGRENMRGSRVAFSSPPGWYAA
jgi:hypothetical protein